MSEAVTAGDRMRAVIRKQVRTMGADPWLLIVIGIMLAFGLVMVYSASWDVSWRLTLDPSALFRRQLSNMVVALLACALAYRFPLRWLKGLALPMILVAMLTLLTVLLVNAGDGPRRSFLEGSVQPSEMAKLIVIIYLAVWMESKGDRISEWGYGFLPLMVIIGIVGGLILLQPDLSAVLTVGVVALVMFYLAGARASQSILVTLGSGLVGYLLVRVTTTGRQRWNDYMAGLVDIERASYHVQRSLQAFFSGGVLGRGLGASQEKFGLLPAPHTDSIYAVIGEELGLIGALLVLALFCLFLWRGFRLAAQSPDRLGMLLGGGITFWIGVEALVNMAVLLGLVPFAGNALPFFSYGGSSLVTSLTAVGLLLNISRSVRRPTLEQHAEGHVTTIGIGWGHRRRRVSRLGGRRSARREG
ncbi:MAG: hypothetical protein A2Z37_04850 [Chloroflexi bacterium RBG_19FT_COMBO_62_14]|nr:MAG: hypothetical protein A2Z37_04850 [Chloroflexi bacterium RBG_19FT_COMBO_62_14]